MKKQHFSPGRIGPPLHHECPHCSGRGYVSEDDEQEKEADFDLDGFKEMVAVSTSSSPTPSLPLSRSAERARDGEREGETERERRREKDKGREKRKSKIELYERAEEGLNELKRKPFVLDSERKEGKEGKEGKRGKKALSVETEGLIFGEEEKEKLADLRIEEVSQAATQAKKEIKRDPELERSLRAFGETLRRTKPKKRPTLKAPPVPVAMPSTGQPPSIFFSSSSLISSATMTSSATSSPIISSPPKQALPSFSSSSSSSSSSSFAGKVKRSKSLADLRRRDFLEDLQYNQKSILEPFKQDMEELAKSNVVRSPRSPLTNIVVPGRSSATSMASRF